MTGVDDVESGRITEGEREVAGGGRRGDSGWERLDIRPWHELEYAAVMEDSDRILADALTPAAWVLLTRIAGCTLDPRLVAPPIMVSRYTYRAPVTRPRATQRSPPQGWGRGRVSRCPAPDAQRGTLGREDLRAGSVGFVRWLMRRSHTGTSFASTEQQRVQALDGGKRERCDPARQSPFPARSVSAHRAEFRPNTLSTS